MKHRYEAVAKLLDHSLLAPNTTDRALEEGCLLAVRYDVASVCIMPCDLPRCVRLLAGSTVKPSATIAFPHGTSATSVKVFETQKALQDGAEEVDVVVNVSRVVSGDFRYVRDELAEITQHVHAARAKIKVIFETCFLDEAQKIALCTICGDIGADWAKTSTGFGPQGATLDDVALLRARCPAQVQNQSVGGDTRSRHGARVRRARRYKGRDVTRG